MSGNNVELKCIFNLFDSNNTGEIDIKQINKINKSIESLAVKKKQGNSPTNFTITQTKLDNDKALPPRPAKKPDQRDVGDNLMNRTQGMSKNVGNRKASYENLGDADKSKPLQTNGKKWGNNSNNMINLNNSKDINDTNSSLDSIDDDMGLPYEREKAETVNTMDLRYFPNKKTTISFNEFCQIFNDSISSKDIQDDILLACFNAFDHDCQGYIDSKKIKDIFDVFKERITNEEIQNVLKFVGCVDDKMSFKEFKEFFKKNL